MPCATSGDDALAARWNSPTAGSATTTPISPSASESATRDGAIAVVVDFQKDRSYVIALIMSSLAAVCLTSRRTRKGSQGGRYAGTRVLRGRPPWRPAPVLVWQTVRHAGEGS